jgi:hypothetical protein
VVGFTIGSIGKVPGKTREKKREEIIIIIIIITLAPMIEAASTSETSVNFNHTTWRRNIPEDSHLNARRRESLNSH